MLSQETIREPDGSVEALKKPQAILPCLQSVHQFTGQTGETLNSKERDKAPSLL